MTPRPDSTRIGPAASLWARLARAREAFRASLDPRTESEARIVSEQLAMISNSGRYHGVLLPLIGGVIALSFAGTVPWPHILAWWGAVTVLFGGAALAGRFRPPAGSELRREDVARAAKAFTFACTLLTAAWCAILPALWLPGEALNHVMLVLVIAASMASSASINAPHFASGRIALWIYGTTLAIVPNLMDDSFHLTFTLMAIAYWVSMEFQASSNFTTTQKMLSLQDERNGLIEDLQNAKSESDDARDRAELASQAKSQFLANMSHELRTPLNAILGFSELIQSGIGADKPGRHIEYARLVHESGQHLLALINDILDLAKIEAGGLQLQERPVDFGHLILDSVQLMDGKAVAGGIVLRTDLPQRLPPVTADERAMRQIFLNLLSNALKFTPPGGEVVAFAHVEDGGALVCGVSDTGVGIAEDDQTRVFEKFGQGRHDVVTLEKGTGLGLSIVKGLAAAHGGTVTLTSRIGEGTCVSLRLPPERRYCDEALAATA